MSADQPSAKRQKVVDSEEKEAQEAEEATCAICFEGERTVLERHGCDQCKPGAWHICEICNDSLLSRTCPFCKGDYRELKLYQMPGLQVNAVRDPSLSQTDKMVLMIKIKALGDSLIPAGNTLLWQPLDADEPEAAGRALFVLPRGFGQPSDGGSAVSSSVLAFSEPAASTVRADARGTAVGDTATASAESGGSDDSVALISVNMHYDELGGGGAGSLEFNFVNSTWSMLEGAVEGAEGVEGEGESGGRERERERERADRENRGGRAGTIEFQNTGIASAAVLRKAISTKGAVLLLPLAPTYWKEIESDLLASVLVAQE